MSETEARKAIEDYFAAFNNHDVEGMRATLQFPHIGIYGSEVHIENEASEFTMPFRTLTEKEGWHHSTLDSVETVLASKNKFHFRIVFSRFNRDGAKYLTQTMLWIVTRKDDRWGILCRSL